MVGGKAVKIALRSDMPKSGVCSIELDMEGECSFQLCLRMPAWSDGVVLKINGKTEKILAGDDGYITLERRWKAGDKVEFDFSMPVLLEETCAEVKANIGYVSVRRGPLVYCFEQIDHEVNLDHVYLDVNAKAELVWTDSIDGKADPYGVRDMYLIKLAGYLQGAKGDTPVELTFLPFYARMNRGKTRMRVYIAKEAQEKKIAAFATPSASFTCIYDAVSHLNDGSDSKDRRWTSWKDGTVLKDPWVQYDFQEEIVLSGCNIWWYDDGGGVRLADGFEILYKNSETDTFTPVSHEGDYKCSHGDGFITYEFEATSVKSLRIVMHNSKAAAGIVEWDVIAGSLGGDVVDPPVDPSEDLSKESSGDEPSEESAPVASSKDEPASEKPSENTSKGENGEKPKEKGSILPYIMGGALALAAVAAVVAFVVAKKKKS